MTERTVLVFNDEEKAIMDLLIEAHNRFVQLIRMRDDEMSEWVLSLHRLQDILTNRFVIRNCPEFFK